MFEAVLQAIGDHDRIILHRHTNPDGDALGSQIGLKLLLAHNFPEKEILAVGDAAGRYAFMHGSVMDEVPDEAYRDALAIILDTSAARLISDPRYTLAKTTVRIDHHLFVEKIADVEVTDSTFESCCGLIAAFADECALALTPAAAEALYTGMVTDSGRFRYDATNARTHRLAALLLEQGFDTNEIYRQLYSDDFSRILLRAQFVQKIRFTPNRVAYIYTTRDELAASGADSFTISRGMVSTMAEIRGVDVWVNFTETEQGVLCELRSSRYNINPIAVRFGGGGHAKASGATVKNKDEAMSMLDALDRLSGETNA